MRRVELSTIVTRLKRLFYSTFVRNVATVAGATAIAQLVTVALSPVITRLYGPAAFGMLGVFTSVYTTMTPLAAFGYDAAVVIPKDDSEGWALVRLAATTTLIVGVVTALALVPGRALLAEAMGLEADPSLLFLIPLALVGTSLVQILTQWFIRLERFRAPAAATLTQAGLSNGGKIGLGFFWPTGAVLIVVTTVTHLVKAMLLFVLGRSSIPYTRAGLRRMAREYRDFPVLHIPTELAARLGDAGPTIVLAAVFSPAAAGLYELSRRIIKLPSQLIARSVGKVFRGRIAKSLADGKSVRSDLLRTAGGLLAVALIPYGIIVAFGPPLFAFVFGDEWAGAGQIARLLAVWFVLHVALTPAQQVLLVTRQLRIRLATMITGNIVKLLGLLLVAIVSSNVVASVATYVAVSMAVDLIIFALALTAAGTPSQETAL